MLLPNFLSSRFFNFFPHYFLDCLDTYCDSDIVFYRLSMILMNSLSDGLVDAYAQTPMGITAENLAKKYNITREVRIRE